jgi:hypothetical protein
MRDTRCAYRRTLSCATVLAAGWVIAGCAVIDRGPDGSPRMARLSDGGIISAPAPLSPQERERLDAENARILREQEAAITAERRAAARAYAYRAAPYYPYYPAYVIPYASSVGFYGHWGSRGRYRGGSSVGISFGYPGHWGPGWRW